MEAWAPQGVGGCFWDPHPRPLTGSSTFGVLDSCPTWHCWIPQAASWEWPAALPAAPHLFGGVWGLGSLYPSQPKLWWTGAGGGGGGRQRPQSPEPWDKGSFVGL